MNTKLSAFILIFVMLLGILAGCTDSPNLNATTAPATESSTSRVSETQAETEATTSTTTAVATTIPSEDYTCVYDDLLFEIYQHILAITFDPDLVGSKEGDAGIYEVVSSLSEEDALRAVGFTEKDINDDNIPELLVYLIDDNGNKKIAGNRILAAYTYVNDAPALIFEGASRNRYYLLSDGLIYNEGSNGAAYSIFGTYNLNAGSTELTSEHYYFTADTGADHEIEFYHNTTGEFDTEKSEKFTDGKDAFWNIQEDFAKDIQESELRPFEVFSAGPDDNDPSYVSAVFIDDTLVDLTNAHRFTADNSDYEQEVVFFANFGDVYDFTFCSLEWSDDSNSGESFFKFVPIYTTDALTEDTPLVVTMTFWGDIPAYGITYTDSEGVEHTGTLTISGMDGSLVLDIT